MPIYHVATLLYIATAFFTAYVSFIAEDNPILKAILVTLLFIDIPVGFFTRKKYVKQKEVAEENLRHQKSIEAQEELKKWDDIEQKGLQRAFEAPIREKEQQIEIERIQLQLDADKLKLEKEKVEIQKQAIVNLKAEHDALIACAEKAKYLAMMEFAKKIAYDNSPNWKKTAEEFYTLVGEMHSNKETKNARL